MQAAARRELTEKFTPLGEFRVRNPDSYKLVRELEKEHKQLLVTLREFHFNTLKKAALPFVMKYTKLAEMVKASGLKMDEVFPGIERAYKAQAKAYERGGYGGLTLADVINELERKKNTDLNHEFTIGASPVPKGALQQMESIWSRGRVPEIGEDFRTLSGVAPRIPRLYEHQVGETIIKQMGGFGKLKAMLGARNFVWIKDGVTFLWPSKQRSRGNAVEITLRPDDTYDVTFYNVTNKARKEVKSYSNVYADALKRVFQDQTGLRLSL